MKELEDFDKNLHDEEKKAKNPNEQKEDEVKHKKVKTENCYQRLVMYCTRQGKCNALHCNGYWYSGFKFKLLKVWKIFSN